MIFLKRVCIFIGISIGNSSCIGVGTCIGMYCELFLVHLKEGAEMLACVFEKIRIYK